MNKIELQKLTTDLNATITYLYKMKNLAERTIPNLEKLYKELDQEIYGKENE